MIPKKKSQMTEIAEATANVLKLIVLLQSENGESTINVSPYVIYFSFKVNQSWFAPVVNLGLLLTSSENSSIIKKIRSHTDIIAMITDEKTAASMYIHYKLDKNSLLISENKSNMLGTYTLVAANYYPLLFFELTDTITLTNKRLEFHIKTCMDLLDNRYIKLSSYIRPSAPPFIRKLTYVTSDKGSRLLTILNILHTLPSYGCGSTRATIELTQKDIVDNVSQYVNTFSDIYPFYFNINLDDNLLYVDNFYDIVVNSNPDQNEYVFLMTITDPTLPSGLVEKYKSKWSNKKAIKVMQGVTPHFVNTMRNFVHNRDSIIELRLNFNSLNFTKTYKLNSIMSDLGLFGLYRYDEPAQNKSDRERDRYLRLTATYVTLQRVASQVLNDVYCNTTFLINTPFIPLGFFSDARIWKVYKFWILSMQSEPTMEVIDSMGYSERTECYERYCSLIAYSFEATSEFERPSALEYDTSLYFGTPSLRSRT